MLRLSTSETVDMLTQKLLLMFLLLQDELEMLRRHKAFQKEIEKLLKQGVAITKEMYETLCVQFGIPLVNDDDDDDS